MKNKINRFERKWVFKSKNYLALINSLLRSELFFINQYPSRKVNSIYFDDLNFSSVRENLDGISNKKKIRVRWYGIKNKLTKPQLEIKSKKGAETSKKNYSINELNDLKFFDAKNLDKINYLVNYKIKSKKKLNPLLSTHYDRQYFISNDKKIRATVDYNLQSIFLNNLSQLNIVKNFNKVCIMELKYPTKLDMHVREKLKNITLRLTKNSKFVNSAFERPIFFS